MEYLSHFFSFVHPVTRWTCLNIFWLRDDSLEDSANLPETHILAEENADDLRPALEPIEDVLNRG